MKTHTSQWALRALTVTLCVTAALTSKAVLAAGCPVSPQLRLATLFYPNGGRFVSVVAHRGLWGKYQSAANNVPENSAASIAAANNGCLDAMELDIKMTSDSQPVLMHDFNLGRTTNAYAFQSGAGKYNPDNNAGYNPPVSWLPANEVTSMSLLTPDRWTTSGNYVLSFGGALLHWGAMQKQTPILLDIKTADAVRAVNAEAIKVMSRPGDVMAIKVNASLYQSRAAFERDSPYIKGIPIFVTNNLGSIDIPKAYDNWVEDPRSALEINVKTYNGILQVELNRTKSDRIASGVFNAIPDYPGGGGRFYNNDGSCCYTLADKYFTDPYSHVRESADQRGDWNYINNQGFTFVTTDDPLELMSFMASKGRR